MIRSHDAGGLRAADVDAEVVLAGWVARRRDHGGVTFLDIRDASGVVQVVCRDLPEVHDLRSEWCVSIAGRMARRGEANVNPNLATGEVEVVASAVTVLSESEPVPFPIDGVDEIESGVDEMLRWKYRYLDLRRSGPARALRTRSRIVSLIRRVMEAHDFVDVETPYLTRSTPEGARDFLVPVRLQPGHWYALPQSPQLFKQLLMVAGLERYYQIARCFRDEDSRADRTPEFTQLDIEMSFLDEEDVYALAEELIATLWREVLDVELPVPFPRMTYAESMRRYGSDKPDLRLDLELVDLTNHMAGTEFRVFQAEHVGAVVVPGGASYTRKELDAWQEWARSRGGKGIAWLLVPTDGELRGSVTKLESERLASLPEAAGAKPGDAILFAAGPRRSTVELLGALRLAVGRQQGLLREDEWRFLWVVEAPMFEPTSEDNQGLGGWTAVHHPFTAPTDAWAASFQDDPEHALARAYDVVGNGIELGGGSIRIHRHEMQQRVFDTIGLSRDEAQSKFGFLLEAFNYGPPPHGGIAFGLDRLAAVLAGTDAIREVMAFPKASSGGDPLTGAPTPITPLQRKEAGIDATPDTD
ncbi:MAG TPA: aspartate--tRNA ligase [Mycobacteriales bacterium]|jgi:aspartyl-tRNA synthetase|nr:aspartate--tRNA ligase [Mycobacteriales bacterium]